MQPSNLELCYSVVQFAQNTLPSLVQDAAAVYNKFKPVLSLFAKCHFIYDQRFVSKEKAQKLGTCLFIMHTCQTFEHSTEQSIITFMDVFRCSFPTATIPVKMHMLEDHTLEWVWAHNIGFGLLGEQDTESIHSRFNSLHCTYAFVPNERGRLRNIMKEYLISITPENVTARPVPKRRKLNQREE